jgi:glycosyltransferase involved in cell wall biosynthesis
MNQRWLILSHGFNMDGRASSLTVTDKIPYLLRQGIQPIVLSAVTGEKDQRFPHYQLLPWGPAGLRFDFRHWVATQYGRGVAYKVLTPLASLLLLPFIAVERLVSGLSSQSSWSLPAAVKGIILAKQGKVDLIFSSGGAWSAHYAAWLIKKVTDLPWIAEIHDPMVIRDNEADDGVRPRKRKDARFLQKLEGLICKDGNHVWWFTEGALAYAKQRHPILGEKGFVVFPGSEPPGCHEPLSITHEYGGNLNLCHFGSLAHDRSIGPILEALNIFFQEVPEARNRIKVQVYGAGLDAVSKETINRLKMQSVVMAHGRIENDPVTGETGRERIMKLMRASDVLLGLHGNYEWCAEYIPSKLYDYYWTNRPILAVTNRNAQLDQILTAKNAYLSHTLDITSIVEAIRLIWADWQTQSLRTMPFEPITPEAAVRQILQRVR